MYISTRSRQRISTISKSRKQSQSASLPHISPLFSSTEKMSETVVRRNRGTPVQIYIPEIVLDQKISIILNGERLPPTAPRFIRLTLLDKTKVLSLNFKAAKSNEGFTCTVSERSFVFFEVILKCHRDHKTARLVTEYFNKVGDQFKLVEAHTTHVKIMCEKGLRHIVVVHLDRKEEQEVLPEVE